MRKPFRPFIIIGLIAAIGVFFGLTYKFPEIEVFQYYQNIDQQIITCENKSPETLETTLNTLQESIRNVISVGKTYDGKEDVTELFTSFNTAYEGLKKYTADVSFDEFSRPAGCRTRSISRKKRNPDRRFRAPQLRASGDHYGICDLSADKSGRTI